MELPPKPSELLSASQIADLRLAASTLSGAKRRAFQAAMSLKYCQGNPRLTETVFGWGRDNVALGLAEHRSGIICICAQSYYGGPNAGRSVSQTRPLPSDSWQKPRLSRIPPFAASWGIPV